MSRNPLQLKPDDRGRPDPAHMQRLQEEVDAGLAQARGLIEQGRDREALVICRRLYATAPHDSEVLGLLGLATARNGNLARGLEHLAAALLRSPRNPRVLYNLAQVYLRAGAPVHALHSLRTYRAEVQAIPVAHSFPGCEALIATLVAFMHEEPGVADLPPDVQDRAMMAAERGRMRLLFNEDPEKALPELREAARLAPRYPQPRNNLSLAYFYDGQIGQALATLETALREVDPDNVYALATLAFLRWAGGAAAADCHPLLTRAAVCLTPSSRLLDRTRVAEVAGALGLHALAYDVLAGGDTAPPAEADSLDGTYLYAVRRRLLATAAANLGRPDEATELLRSVPPAAGDALGRRVLAAVEAGEPLPVVVGGGYPYLAWDDLLSLHMLRRLAAPAPPHRIALRPPPPPSPDQVAARLPALYPRLPLACALLIWMGEPLLENLGLTLLALVGSATADDLLDAHLRGALGSYSGRQQAGYALLDSGRLRNGAVIPFWSGTAWAEIRLFRLSPQQRDLAALLRALQTLLGRLGAPGDA